MHLGRTILHLWLRKQHICVYQTKSICRENTVLKFLGLVSHSQGYGSALDCSTLTPLSASTPRRKLQIQSKMHVYDTYHVLHPLNSGDIAQKCWRQCSYSWNIPIQGKHGSEHLPSLQSWSHRLCPRGGCSKDRDGQEPSGTAGGPSSSSTLGGAEQLHQNSQVRKICLKVKPTKLVMTSGTAGTLHEDFTPDPPHFTSFPISDPILSSL